MTTQQFIRDYLAKWDRTKDRRNPVALALLGVGLTVTADRIVLTPHPALRRVAPGVYEITRPTP